MRGKNLKEVVGLDSKNKAIKIARLCLDKKAEDVVVLEMKELTTFTDYFVICSGESVTQVRAIAEHVEETLAKSKAKRLLPFSVQGLSHSHWVLMDYSDVIVHIFEKNTRQYYMLEKLWLDAPRLRIGNNRP